MATFSPMQYAIEDISTLQTPALVLYRDFILKNTERAIALAGGAKRLWPHVKSHKMCEMIWLQMRMGINRFKCATIAEAQMAADCRSEHILLAYPLVGPNIGRFVRLQLAYPSVRFYAIGDSLRQLELLGQASAMAGVCTQVLLDVDMGMHRTGVPLAKAKAFYAQCERIAGLRMVGLHCYDGHIHADALAERKRLAEAATEKAHAITAALRAQGHHCELLVMGGTPTFPVHAQYGGVYLSPGTAFLGDVTCAAEAAEQKIIPAAGVWTRVISRPGERLFTLDAGTKAVSTDMPGACGVIVGLEDAQPVRQSEEHWVLKMPKGKQAPNIGDAFFVIPQHICTTMALYPYAHVVKDRNIVDRWEVTARNRTLDV